MTFTLPTRIVLQSLPDESLIPPALREACARWTALNERIEDLEADAIRAQIDAEKARADHRRAVGEAAVAGSPLPKPPRAVLAAEQNVEDQQDAARAVYAQRESLAREILRQWHTPAHRDYTARAAAEQLLAAAARARQAHAQARQALEDARNDLLHASAGLAWTVESDADPEGNHFSMDNRSGTNPLGEALGALPPVPDHDLDTVEALAEGIAIGPLLNGYAENSSRLRERYPTADERQALADEASAREYVPPTGPWGRPLNAGPHPYKFRRHD